MAKRGRKPKEKKQYFCINEEDAIVQYIESTDEYQRNSIFNNILYPALTKMIESIIRRYKLFVPDEEFDQNFSDTISYLLTKINNFKPIIIGYTEIIDIENYKKEAFIEMPYEEFRGKVRSASETDPEYIKVFIPQTKKRGSDDIFTHIKKYYKRETHNYKAYSYCGTVCKNYLMAKCSQYVKNKQRNLQYDEIYEELDNNIEYVEPMDAGFDVNTTLINSTADKIEEMINNKEANFLTDEEVIVGNALTNLLRNWEEVLPYNGSNKLQKNSILYFLREQTMMTTKEVRMYMKKFKLAYYALKEFFIKNDNDDEVEEY